MIVERIDSFAARWRESYPGAVRALLRDRESLTVARRGCADHPRPHVGLLLRSVSPIRHA
jgi:hypothetical protein